MAQSSFQPITERCTRDLPADEKGPVLKANITSAEEAINKCYHLEYMKSACEPTFQRNVLLRSSRSKISRARCQCVAGG
jgi:hypothetical protein